MSLYYNYHISMEFYFNEGVAYHLFDIKGYSSTCSRGCCCCNVLILGFNPPCKQNICPSITSLMGRK